MKAKIIETYMMPDSDFVAITLFGFIITRDRGRLSRQIINHELIHCRQQLETLYIPFFLIYLLEYLVRLAISRNRDKAYRSISFEREAYANASDPSYLGRRRPYAWLSLLFS